MPKVYPRECGAADADDVISVVASGLSPRVRGSLVRTFSGKHNHRSIPASAGQPMAWIRRLRYSRVYPRECGAAALTLYTRPDCRGLSPRVRGSQRLIRRIKWWMGSIPASAGQPSTFPQVRMWITVYPRECGAATQGHPLLPEPKGLSPRVRGSHPVNPGMAINIRSIPASAGQPTCAPDASRAARVYPRECGAAGSLALG